MTPTTLTPDTIARIEDSFRDQGLMRHLGAEIAAIRPAEVTLRLPFRPELTQQMGYFHAGATTALADSAGGYAALT
ncbi:PaaI family thioesterase, partial [Phascolarctobacterium faecium]|nr:PaaI family thioesterase [Phascolarctobacterium faecium]